MHNRVQTK